MGCEGGGWYLLLLLTIPSIVMIKYVQKHQFPSENIKEDQFIFTVLLPNIPSKITTKIIIDTSRLKGLVCGKRNLLVYCFPTILWKTLHKVWTRGKI